MEKKMNRKLSEDELDEVAGGLQMDPRIIKNINTGEAKIGLAPEDPGENFEGPLKSPFKTF